MSGLKGDLFLNGYFRLDSTLQYVFGNTVICLPLLVLRVLRYVEEFEIGIGETFLHKNYKNMPIISN
jgi:hypothetical protein